MTRSGPDTARLLHHKLITQRTPARTPISSYRDTWRLLLTFTEQSTGTPPWHLDLAQLDHDVVTAFLSHLETDRNNSPSTRNARLAAIHSLFRYAALHAPDDAATIQRVLAIEGCRTARAEIGWLTDAEADALLAACDRTTWIGRRDHAAILTDLRTGLRVSELIHLTCDDVRLGSSAHVHCLGKGRKERRTPLDKPTAAVLRTGLPSAPDNRPPHCFPRGADKGCPAMHFTPASPNTNRSPRRPAHRWPRRSSRPMSCDTPPR